MVSTSTQCLTHLMNNNYSVVSNSMYRKIGTMDWVGRRNADISMEGGGRWWHPVGRSHIFLLNQLYTKSLEFRNSFFLELGNPNPISTETGPRGSRNNSTINSQSLQQSSNKMITAFPHRTLILAHSASE
jgi:hypothetical protein